MRGVVPVSYESRYRQLDVRSGGGGFSANREFEFGQRQRRGAQVVAEAVWSPVFTKNFHTSHFRGERPGDTTGCLAPASAAAPGAGPAAGRRRRTRSSAAGRPTPTIAFPIRSRRTLARQGVAFVPSTSRTTFKYGFPEDTLRRITRFRRAAATDLGHHLGRYKLSPNFRAVGSASRAFSPRSILVIDTLASPSATVAGANANNFSSSSWA